MSFKAILIVSALTLCAALNVTEVALLAAQSLSSEKHVYSVDNISQVSALELLATFSANGVSLWFEIFV